MPNVSQMKRKRMLEFLEKVKEEHKNDDEMLIALGEIENELNSKKYGLVWEEHEEKVDVQMRTHIPVYTEVKEREISFAPEQPYNFLLEGDNLHSLYLLEKTHKGKIDIIYIDPPYNTGKKDFIYDDNYVEKEDSFRHSKWISFIEKRLSIAYNLLSEKGVIFISIDDNEQANLKLLCDDLFGEDNFVALLAVENNPKGRKNSAFVSVSNDYLLIYAKDTTVSGFIENIPKDIKDLAQDDSGNFVHNSGKRVLVGENQFNANVTDFNSDKHYTVYYNSDTHEIKIVKEDSVTDVCSDLLSRGFNRYYSYNANGFVLNTYTAEKLLELFEDSALDFKNGKIYEKNFSTNIRIKSIITNRKYKAVINNAPTDFSIDVKTTSAKQELKKIFNLKEAPFSNPKNVGLLKLIITLFDNKHINILDFFAGSGTTAQAVIEQNQLDGGNRRFVLCTNNESQICDNVTYPRIKTVITGKRADGSSYSDGIPANLKYYRTDFVARDEEFLSDALSEHIAEMIQLEHGVKIDESKYLMIMSDAEADELQKHFKEYGEIKAIYVSKNVLLTAEQKSLFKNIEIHIIPDNYFSFELREEEKI